jgi:hypothetical protein
VVPSPDQEEDPTHVPFQVHTRSEGAVSTQSTDSKGTGVPGVEPLTQVFTLTAPEDAYVSTEVHPRTPPPSPSLSPPSTISRGRSRLPRKAVALAPGRYTEPPPTRRALPRGVLPNSPSRPVPTPGSLAVTQVSPGPPVLSPRSLPRVVIRESTPEPPVDPVP